MNRVVLLSLWALVALCFVGSAGARIHGVGGCSSLGRLEYVKKCEEDNAQREKEAALGGDCSSLGPQSITCRDDGLRNAGDAFQERNTECLRGNEARKDECVREAWAEFHAAVDAINKVYDEGRS